MLTEIYAMPSFGFAIDVVALLKAQGHQFVKCFRESGVWYVAF